FFGIRSKGGPWQITWGRVIEYQANEVCHWVAVRTEFAYHHKSYKFHRNWEEAHMIHFNSHKPGRRLRGLLAIGAIGGAAFTLVALWMWSATGHTSVASAGTLEQQTGCQFSILSFHDCL